MFGTGFPDDWSALKRLIWLRLKAGGGEPGEILSVTGISPLVLQNALANHIQSLIQYGKLEQRNLPSGYTELDGITTNGSCVIDTGVKCDVDDMEFEVRARAQLSSWYILQSRDIVGGSIYGISGSSSNATILLAWRGVNLASGITRTVGHVYYIHGTVKNGVSTLYVKDETDGTEDTKTGTYTAGTVECTTNIGIFGNIGSGDKVGSGNGVFMTRIKKAGVVVFDAVSAKDSTTIGVYDAVTDALLTSETGMLTAGSDTVPTPINPMSVWCNNGKLAFGKPLTLNNTRYYAYLAQDLVHWSYSNDSYSIVIPVTVGKKYRIQADSTTPINGVQNVILRWAFVDSVPSGWTSDVTPSTLFVDAYDMVRSTPQNTQDIEVTATRPYMIVQMGAGIFADNIANGRISLTVQEVYAVGTPESLTISASGVSDQVVTGISNLFAIGDYKDMEELVDGIRTGKVGVYVFTGQETVAKGNSVFTIDDLLDFPNENFTPFCTRYKGIATNDGITADSNQIRMYHTSSGTIKKRIGIYAVRADYANGAELAAEFARWYAEGNPAMLFYPKAEATTEQTTAHALTTARGDNTITANTNVNPVTLACEYWGIGA